MARLRVKCLEKKRKLLVPRGQWDVFCLVLFWFVFLSVRPKVEKYPLLMKTPKYVLFLLPICFHNFNKTSCFDHIFCLLIFAAG